MDYSYLNQAAGFDANCLQGGVDPTGLSNMPCSYSDFSCNQMQQAYRYTAAAASMARSYNPVGPGVGPSTAAAMSGLHHTGSAVSQCSVVGPRAHHQDVHRTSMFPTSMSMQGWLFSSAL